MPHQNHDRELQSRARNEAVDSQSNDLPSSSADHESIELLTGWRGQAVGIMLDEVLAGKRSIRVVMRPDGPHVRLV